MLLSKEPVIEVFFSFLVCFSLSSRFGSICLPAFNCLQLQIPLSCFFLFPHDAMAAEFVKLLVEIPIQLVCKLLLSLLLLFNASSNFTHLLVALQHFCKEISWPSELKAYCPQPRQRDGDGFLHLLHAAAATQIAALAATVPASLSTGNTEMSQGDSHTTRGSSNAIYRSGALIPRV